MTGPAATGRPVPAAARPGHAQEILAGRYRLLRPISAGPRTTLWRAVDEVLARPVAVKILAGDADVERFLSAAARAGRLSHPRVASVYDAALENGLAYIVSEWVDGLSLRSLLRDGPLSPADALAMAIQATEAVAAAHARGVVHRRLHPGNVLLTSSGLVKVTDAEVAGAVRPPISEMNGGVDAGGVDAGGVDEAAALDTRCLGGLLYAALTARWPLAGEDALPRAPFADGRVCTPRQVRAGVPRELDGLATRALEPARRPTLPPVDTAARLLAALNRIAAGRTTASPPETVIPDPSRRRRRGVRAVAPVAVLVVIAGLAWAAGLAVGRVPGTASRLEALVPTASPGAGEPGRPATLPLSSVRDFDPDGDGRENPDKVSLAYDPDTSTAWETDVYRSSARFGGLKSGVGLLVDLGSPTAVGQVTLALTASGADVELRAADTLGARAQDFPLVARVSESKTSVALKPAVPTTARYWLVWLTRLPPSGSAGYREGLANMVFAP